MANIAVNIEMVRLGIGLIRVLNITLSLMWLWWILFQAIKALMHSAQQHGYKPELLQAVENVNRRQRQKLFQSIVTHFGEQLSDRVIALWGLSFKPNTDDMREAPATYLLEALWEKGVRVQAYDPQAMEEAQRLYGVGAKLALMATKEAALINADALVICTDWQVKSPDLDVIKTPARAGIFDGRNF